MNTNLESIFKYFFNNKNKILFQVNTFTSAFLFFLIMKSINNQPKIIRRILAKNTSILLGDYFDNFINQQVQSGKFSSASEVVRAALRMFEYEESKKTELIKELKKREKSGFVKDFNRDNFLNKLHQKHLAK